jgi:uncharacterized membrane protein YeaQ/YmgE (transglycosylase-associated protein family)
MQKYRTGFLGGKHPKEVIDRIKDYSADGGDSTMMKYTKHAFYGSMVGALAGYIGFGYLRQNKIMGAVLGLVGGGIAGKLLGDHLVKNKDKKDTDNG